MDDKEKILGKGFKALRPKPEYSDDVIAPPYDVLNSEEARDLANGKPYSFLHISKPEIDLPEDIKADDPRVYKKGLENLKQMINENILIKDDKESLFIYKITTNDHEQTGIAFVASIDAYEDNLIKKHEHTTPVKELDRINNMKALNAQTGPVLLTYIDNTQLDEMINQYSIENQPIYDVNTRENINHKIWQITDINEINEATTGLNKLESLYIADGHHRSAAASKVRESRMNANPEHGGSESYNHFLAVAFPKSEMKILDYNRLIKHTNGKSTDELIAMIEDNFKCTVSDKPVKPIKGKSFGMFTDGRWFSLELKSDFNKNSPVDSLDISILHNFILDPILGIEDERVDKNIDFVGGARGLEELERRVNSTEMAIAFSLYPTPIDALISVADAGLIMPPKSTWFEPKLLDGLLSHIID
jgi:uncharacterized protein (DUF1015 family)|tara:strand:- start:746 stop:2002 length:1257 start_codon:yes stop_codon:yes gene_type:complete